MSKDLYVAGDTIYKLCQPDNQLVTSERGFVTLAPPYERHCTMKLQPHNGSVTIVEQLSEELVFQEFAVCERSQIVIGSRNVPISCEHIGQPYERFPNVRLRANVTIEIITEQLRTQTILLAFHRNYFVTIE